MPQQVHVRLVSPHLEVRTTRPVPLIHNVFDEVTPIAELEPHGTLVTFPHRVTLDLDGSVDMFQRFAGCRLFSRVV